MDPTDYNLTSPNTTQDDYKQSYNEDNETWTEADDGDYYYILEKTNITLYSLISILGIIGNGLVIWIAGFRMKKTISAVWFLHLAIADFLCCAFLPFRIAEEVDIHLSVPEPLFCILRIIIFDLNMSASIFFLTAMSIDRCVTVMWPFWGRVRRTPKLVRITAGIISVLSLLMMCFALYTRGWCVNLYHNHSMMLDISFWIDLFILFVIPFLIIVTSYVTIFLKFRKSKRPPRSQRPYRIITAVILCFFICWAPYHFWPLVVSDDGDYVLQLYVVHYIYTILPYLNSCINPIIYVFMGQDFRHSFLRSIPFRLEKAISDHPDDPCREQVNCEETPNTDL